MAKKAGLTNCWTVSSYTRLSRVALDRGAATATTYTSQPTSPTCPPCCCISVQRTSLCWTCPESISDLRTSVLRPPYRRCKQKTGTDRLCTRCCRLPGQSGQAWPARWSSGALTTCPSSDHWYFSTRRSCWYNLILLPAPPTVLLVRLNYNNDHYIARHLQLYRSYFRWTWKSASERQPIANKWVTIFSLRFSDKIRENDITAARWAHSAIINLTGRHSLTVNGTVVRPSPGPRHWRHGYSEKSSSWRPVGQ